MQKIKFPIIFLAIVLIASCANAGDKAAGSYSGDYKELDSTYQVSTVINFHKVTNDKVDMSITMPLGVYYVVKGITVALDGDNVIFVYDTDPTSDDQIISASGTLTGNNLHLNFVIYYSSGNIFSVFNGTKE